MDAAAPHRDRPSTINALVDVTNYLTFDQGRPLHVFDAKKVAGDLVVRRASDGEKLLALDGREYTLTREMASSPTTRASNPSPASWAASIPAATRTRPTC